MSVPDKSIDPRLLASAEAEFLDKGFIKAELKTICENAGITTGAVYKRYKGKEEVFCAVVDDIAGRLDAFVEERSNIDFSSLSDEEIYQSWQMTYDAMIPLFNLLYKHHDTFTLLINKAAGTRYENFNHDFVTRMSNACMTRYTAEQIVEMLKAAGFTEISVNKKENLFLVMGYGALSFPQWICRRIWESLLFCLLWSDSGAVSCSF